jgi:hypothetical protein
MSSVCFASATRRPERVFEAQSPAGVSVQAQFPEGIPRRALWRKRLRSFSYSGVLTWATKLAGRGTGPGCEKDSSGRSMPAGKLDHGQCSAAWTRPARSGLHSM